MFQFLLPLLGLGGKVAGAMAGGAAKNRQAVDQDNLRRDELRLLAQRDFRDSQNDAYTNSMRSAHVKNYKPTAPPPGIYNAYEGRTSSPDQMQAADAMQRRAMIELLRGKPMDVSQPQRRGWMEKILGPASLGLGLASAVGNQLNGDDEGAPQDVGASSGLPFGLSGIGQQQPMEQMPGSQDQFAWLNPRVRSQLRF
jgi:hypothetical protein